VKAAGCHYTLDYPNTLEKAVPTLLRLSDEQRRQQSRVDILHKHFRTLSADMKDKAQKKDREGGAKKYKKLRISGDAPGATLFFKTEGQSQEAHGSWFRANTATSIPHWKISSTSNPRSSGFCMAGFPPQPTIAPDTRIVAFGSCFAENITKHLAKRNFNVLTRKDGDSSSAYVVRSAKEWSIQR